MLKEDGPGAGSGVQAWEVVTELLEFILGHIDGLRRIVLGEHELQTFSLTSDECARVFVLKLDEYVRALAMAYFDNARIFLRARLRVRLTVAFRSEILRDSRLTHVGVSQLPLYIAITSRRVVNPSVTPMRARVIVPVCQKQSHVIAPANERSLSRAC